MRKSELRDLIFEALGEVLADQATLATTTQTVLSKFPTLKKTIVNLFTDQYNEFLENIDWVAPKPTTFRVVLKNKQAFYLKWLGEQFQAQIEGKRYFLGKTDEFQQALDRLSELLRQNEPVSTPEQEDDFQEPGAEADFSAAGTGGDFPGTEPAAADLDTPEEAPEGDDFDFEEPGEEPEA